MTKIKIIYMHIYCWFDGWRRDYENWWVRALPTESVSVPDDMGFVQESSVTVRDITTAYAVSTRARRKS
jgi:hypothetical protein